MRRALQMTAVLVGLVLLSVGIAVAVSPAPRNATTPLGETTHVYHYFRNGPGSFCEFTATTGKCGVSAAVPASFTLPAGAAHYSCTLTASVQYRTVGAGAFSFAAAIFTDNGTVSSIPASRPVGSTHGGGDSRTLVYRPALLRPGVAYQISLDAGLTPNTKVKGSSSISTSNILTDLECSPA